MALNANAAYAEAARAWEGDILFLVSADDQAPHGEGIHLDLSQGRCRAATFIADASSVSSEFVVEARRSEWARLFVHELDPIKAILDRTFRVRGNLAKLMRFTKAAKELVETAAAVPTDR